MRARLADVAAEAGVSEATVSRVLNGKPFVSEETRDRVLQAVDVLGYQLPERLRRPRHGTVGLIVPELSNPVFPRYVTAIERALLERGMVPLLCSTVTGGTLEDDYVAMLVEQRVAGIIFICGIHAVADAEPERYLELRRAGIPFVHVEGYLPEALTPTLSTDDRLAVQSAVDHLLDLDHRRLGLVAGPLRYTAVQRRVAAFYASLARKQGHESISGAGAPDDAAPSTREAIAGSVEHDLFTLDGGRAAAGRLLDLGATGLVCASDLMALGAVAAARDRGLRVPEDISVVGSDDSPMLPFTDPPLTTVAHPVELISEAAVRAVVAAVEGRPLPHTEALFPPTLVVRGSTASAVDDAAGAGKAVGIPVDATDITC